MTDPIVVVAYDPAWPAQFHQIAWPIREALGDVALRIDHIGSTSVPAMAAKPVIDVQISVASLEPFYTILLPMERLGYRWREDNPDRTKRYFREPEGTPRTHVHVRVSGSWSEQLALLFRDYLRAHSEYAGRYSELKYQLAKDFGESRQGYLMAKEPFIWEVLQRANTWSQETGWVPGPTDH